MLILCIFAGRKPLFKATNLHSKLMDNISHSGIVESIIGNIVNVRIRQTSACAACKVAGYQGEDNQRDNPRQQQICSRTGGRCLHVRQNGDKGLALGFWCAVHTSDDCFSGRHFSLRLRGDGCHYGNGLYASVLLSALAHARQDSGASVVYHKLAAHGTTT